MGTDDLILLMDLKLKRDERERQEERIRRAQELQDQELAAIAAAEATARAELIASRREQVENELMQGVAERYAHLGDDLELDPVMLERAVQARLRREGLEP